MPSPWFAFAFFSAAVAAPLGAATSHDLAQPEFQRLQPKDPSASARVEKPMPAQAVEVEVRTEMHAVLGQDGVLRLECSDASHSHRQVAPATTQESE